VATARTRSTTAAIVAAAAGGAVAKHGNRAVSSVSGSADVLEALGFRLELPPERIAESIDRLGFGFMFAPAHHPAMKHAAPVRRELGTRTIFNVLGPLTNPAGVRRQVIGVCDRRWVVPVAEALVRLGAERAWVVHGAGGLDEVALEGETVVAEVSPGRVRIEALTSADAGLAPAPLAALRVGSPAEAAALLRAVLGGASGPARDVVRLNAAAALVVAGAARDVREGVALASGSIDSGAAARVLEGVVEFTRRQADVGAA